MANAASLQGQEQMQQPQETANQETGNQNKGKSKSKEERLATKKCVCGLVHLFEKCPHLVQSNRPPGWTESKKKREDIRQQICMRSVKVFKAIKRTTDACFANGPDRRSAEGYTFKLFGGMIEWASRKQLTVSTSTTEAELLSMLHAGKELI